MNKVVLTGAAGGIGTRLRPLLKPHYGELVLSDIVEPADLSADEPFIAADLTDLEAIERAVAGADGVVHMGGISVEHPWEDVLQANIIGIRNLYEAARRQGVKRVVFASSNHAVGFYRRIHRIGTDVTVRPDSHYGVSKAFGEAMGAFYADKFGLRVFCIRIGNVDDLPADNRRLSIWISPEDLVSLIRIGLDHPDIHFEIVYGASSNQRSWWDNATAYRLGYQPTGESEDHVDHALAEQAKLAPDPVGDLFQGGAFCSDGFEGDPDRIDPQD